MSRPSFFPREDNLIRPYQFCKPSGGAKFYFAPNYTEPVEIISKLNRVRARAERKGMKKTA